MWGCPFLLRAFISTASGDQEPARRTRGCKGKGVLTGDNEGSTNHFPSFLVYLASPYNSCHQNTMNKVILFIGTLFVAAASAEVEKHCPRGGCPSSLSVTLPPPLPPCHCTKPCGPTCTVLTVSTETLSPSMSTITTKVPKTITTFSSCPLRSNTTTFETVTSSYTTTSVRTLSNSTTTILSTVTNVVCTKKKRCSRCSLDSRDCGCGSNWTTTLNPPTEDCFRRCYYGCPQVQHDDRHMYVLPKYTSCYSGCPTVVPIPIAGVPPVVPVCPSCPPLPTVTITPDSYVITIIAHGPSPTSLNTSCLTA